jgi:hypothetical protein
MQQSDFARFRAVMTGMGELYQRELSGPLLDAYWLALRDWSLADFEGAAAHLMATATFMPRPAEFNALRKAGRPTAGEVWPKVVEFVRRGYYRWEGGPVSRNNAVPIPELPDLARAAVQALGGFHVIAMHDESKLHFLERRFAEHYDAMRDAEDVRAAVPQIAAHGASALPMPNLRIGRDA